MIQMSHPSEQSNDTRTMMGACKRNGKNLNRKSPKGRARNQRFVSAFYAINDAATVIDVTAFTCIPSRQIVAETCDRACEQR